jgi:outer membrane beta-barrel protein
MRTLASTLILSAALAAAAPCALAQQTAPASGQQPANEQVIQPEVARRPIRIPKFPSKDFEVGLFSGTYATQNFGSSLIYGLRLGYHITEDFFVEGALAQTKVSDENFRQVLPGGIFPNEKEKLTYYNLSAGYNILPGEVFVGRSTAWASQLYLMAGIGSTKFFEQRKQTLNFGLGLRVYLKDWAAIQIDMRDHVFSLDLLGRRENTQNLELTAGFTFFF